MTDFCPFIGTPPETFPALIIKLAGNKLHVSPINTKRQIVSLIYDVNEKIPMGFFLKYLTPWEPPKGKAAPAPEVVEATRVRFARAIRSAEDWIAAGGKVAKIPAGKKTHAGDELSLEELGL